MESLSGNHAAALVHFARAESLGVTNPHFHANYGLELLQAGRPADAAAELLHSLSQDSTRASVWSHLGVARLRTHRTEDALAAMRRASALAPTDEDLRYNLASTLIQLGRYADAESVLQQPAPQRADLLAVRGLARRGLDRKPEALADLRRAAELAPRNTDILNNYGVLLAETGDVPGALAAWHHVLEIEPGNRTARENLAARGGAPAAAPVQKE